MKLYQFIVILVLGGMAGAILTSIEIPIVKNKQFQQFIREEGPQSHGKKEGTPTMGGIAIFCATLAAAMIGIKPTPDLFVIVLVAVPPSKTFMAPALTVVSWSVPLTFRVPFSLTVVLVAAPVPRMFMAPALTVVSCAVPLTFSAPFSLTVVLVAVPPSKTFMAPELTFVS